MPTSKTTVSNPTLVEVRSAVQAILDKKAENVRLLDVSKKSPITDYIVLATGTSDPHLKAIKGELDAMLKANGVQLIGEDRNIGSGWVVVDGFDFMVHIQTQEMRDLYRLDQLWRDAEELPLEA
jgi:ribosome-associated protein